MATEDLLDNGVAEVLVLQADQATLDSDRLVVAGGGHADVFVEDGQVLVQVASGHVDSQALVRAVLRAPSLRVDGDVLDVVVVGSGGWDRWVLSGDLDHRWLFSRHWDRRPAHAATVTLVGHAPVEAETSPQESSTRRTLGAATRLLADVVGPPGTLHVVNLFTRRTTVRDTLRGGPGDRRADPGVVDDALGASECVLASWGAVAAAGLDAVDGMVDALRARRDAGGRVFVAAVGGTIEVSGSPPQPSATRTLSPGTRLVDAPAAWLWGGPLIA